MSKNRRDFLKTVAAGGALVGLAGCAQAAATPAGDASTSAADTALPTLDWQMATSWPTSLDTLFGGAQAFGDRVAALTGGKFKITARAAGELAPANEVLNVVQQGAVPIGHTASYYYIGKTPAVAFGTTVPFGLNAQQQNSWLYAGGGLKLLQDLYAQKFGVIQFPAGNTGVQMGGWFRKEINSVADLQGLKMRIPGLGGQVMAKLGVTVQAVAVGEIFQSLQTGAIDAAEWVGPYDDEKLGLNKAAQYYYYPAWWEPGSTLEVEVNLAEWNKLPDFYKLVLQTAAYEANVSILANYDARNNDALQRLVQGGTQLRPYSREILQAADQAAMALYDEFASADADFKAIYEEWKKFRERVYAWNAVNEGGFATYTYGKLAP